MTALNHLQAIVLLPGMVTVVIPILILLNSGRATPGWSLPTPLNWLPVLLGGGLIGLGLLLMAQTIYLFATEGRGTLAPWTPPERLVVHGIYRHVRNPMISGVFGVLLGEAALFGSLPLLWYFGLVVLLNLVYIPLVEEPELERRFGATYRDYRQNVPRWIPRPRPWQPTQSDSNGQGG